VLSLSTLWELSNYDMLSKKKGEKPQEGFFDLINLLSKSKILDIVKEDLKCVSSDGNTLAMYGF
jgi:hypothetical protein